MLRFVVKTCFFVPSWHLPVLKFNIALIDGHLSVTLVKQLQRQLDVRYLVRILCISREKQRDFEHVLKDVKHN